MAKARNEIEKNLKLVDIVIELVDARAPLSSQNPMIQEIVNRKPKLIVLMKADLADPIQTTKWLESIQAEGNAAITVNVNSRQDIAKLIDKVNELGSESREKKQAKGIENTTIRALIVGIPNVGKSSLINRLANKNIAKTGDRPAITRQQQWIKVRGKFELLDTPGVLWPKFKDPLIGKILAAIGTIKYELVPTEDITAYLLQYMHEQYPHLLEKRYGIDNVDDMWEVFEQIGKKRGALESGGQVNFEKVAAIVLLDFRLGRLGLITLEKPIK